MDMKLDYSDIHFKNDGRLKLLIIVGTRPEICLSYTSDAADEL